MSNDNSKGIKANLQWQICKTNNPVLCYIFIWMYYEIWTICSKCSSGCIFMLYIFHFESFTAIIFNIPVMKHSHLTSHFLFVKVGATMTFQYYIQLNIWFIIIFMSNVTFRFEFVFCVLVSKNLVKLCQSRAKLTFNKFSLAYFCIL